MIPYQRPRGGVEASVARAHAAPSQYAARMLGQGDNMGDTMGDYLAVPTAHGVAMGVAAATAVHAADSGFEAPSATSTAAPDIVRAEWTSVFG